MWDHSDINIHPLIILLSWSNLFLIQLTLENLNYQGTKKIVRVIDSSSFWEMGLQQWEWQDYYHGFYPSLIQYKIYHTTNLHTLQSNLLLERNQSNVLFQALCSFFIQKGVYFQSKTTYFAATFLFDNPFSRPFKALHFSAKYLFISFRFTGAIFLKKTSDEKLEPFVMVFLPKNRKNRSNFRSLEFWPKC